MSERIDQSVAKRVTFRAFLASDHVTPATGKTIAITISKNGGAFGNPAAGATNATAIANGYYYFDLGTGDTDTLGPLAYRGAEGTIDDVGDVFTVAVLGTPQTGDSFARIGANGAGLSAVPWNASWDAEVQSEVQDAIETNHLDHLLAADYDPASKPGVSTALLNELVENDAGVSRFTANALEQAPGGTSDVMILASGTIGATGNDTTHLHLAGLTFGNDELNNHLIVITDVSGSEIHVRWATDWVLSTELVTLHEALPFTPEDSTDTYSVLVIRADSPSSLDLGVIVDAVFNATLASYTTEGSAGKALADIESDATAILADTNELQTDWVNGGRLDLLIDAILADTGTDGVVVAAGSKTGYRLSSTGVDDILDEAVEGSITLRQYVRGIAAAVLAKLSGAATTTVTVRDVADTKDRIVATVDVDGNRSAVTLDLT